MKSFYFYDLETTGVNPREDRVMQFAGQRTDMDLNIVGEPHNLLIKLSDDVLPQPDAVLVTGITPQKAIAEGITEAEFLELFQKEIATPGTTFVGFNTVRFDDEFMRFMLYRNFYDPYEWQWKEDRSRWDLLDLARMTRALRPEGIKWPFSKEGKPTNRLELLTKLNDLSHLNAHDALSDVIATIEVAKLIRKKQPKLFDFLLSMRDKRSVKQLVETEELFIYTSGKYSSELEKTTIATKIADTPDGAALVYDLSVDPETFIDMDEAKLIESWTRKYKDPGPRLPVKTLKYNRCPAVAPLSVLDSKSQERLGLSPKLAKQRAKYVHDSELAKRCLEALKSMNKKRESKQSALLYDGHSADSQLYDKFLSQADKPLMQQVRNSKTEDINDNLANKFSDERLKALLPLYKARNFYKNLSSKELEEWDQFRAKRLLEGGAKSRAAKFATRLQQLSATVNEPAKMYLLEELQLYFESILPE